MHQKEHSSSSSGSSSNSSSSSWWWWCDHHRRTDYRRTCHGTERKSDVEPETGVAGKAMATARATRAGPYVGDMHTWESLHVAPRPFVCEHEQAQLADFLVGFVLLCCGLATVQTVLCVLTFLTHSLCCAVVAQAEREAARRKLIEAESRRLAAPQPPAHVVFSNVTFTRHLQSLRERVHEHRLRCARLDKTHRRQAANRLIQSSSASSLSPLRSRSPSTTNLLCTISWRT